MAHVPFDDLARLADGLAAPQLQHLHHLLACRLCRRRVRRLLPELAPEAGAARVCYSDQAPAASRPTLTGFAGQLYESVFTRLAAEPSASSTAVAMAAAEADAAIEGLLALPVRKMERELRQKPAPQAVAILLRVLDRAYEESYPFPSRGHALAEAAFHLSCAVEKAGLPPALLADLKARVHMLCGYTELIERLPQDPGELAFRVAESHIADPEDVEAAVFCRLLAGVRDRQRRIHEALALLERAESLFHRRGETVEESLAVADQAAIYAREGDTERALALSGRSLALREAWLAPAEALRERLLLAFMHAAVGHPWAAQEALAEAERQATAAGAGTPALALLTRAWLTAEAGDREATERLLREALAAAKGASAWGEAAAAAFHLAVLFADEQRRGRLAALADEIEPLFAPETLPSELRALLRELRGLLRGGSAEAERIAGLQRRFGQRVPGGPGPLRGLGVLFDPALTEPLRRRPPQSNLLPFTAAGARRRGGGAAR